MSTWTCDMCTVVNPNARTLCQVCQSPRPKGTPARTSPPVTTPVAATGRASQWKCISCTYDANPASAVVCTICGTKKSSTPVTAAPPVGAPVREPREEDIKFLIDVGYSRDWSIHALKQNRLDKGAAFEWVLANPEPRAAKKPTVTPVAAPAKVATPAPAAVPVVATPPVVVTTPTARPQPVVAAKTAPTPTPVVTAPAKATPVVAVAAPTSGRTTAPAFPPSAATPAKVAVPPVVVPTVATPAKTGTSTGTAPAKTGTAPSKAAPSAAPVVPAAAATGTTTGVALSERKGGATARTGTATTRTNVEEDARKNELEAFKKAEEEKKMELQKKATSMRRDALEEAKRRKTDDETHKRTVEMNKQKERDDIKQKEEEARLKKRLDDEAKLPNIDEALNQMKEEWGLERTALTCSTLSKIVGNIVSHPAEAKYRKVKTTSDVIQRALVRPVQASYIMHKLGFKDGDDCMVIDTPDIAKLTRELAKFKLAVAAASTNVPAIFSGMEGKVSVEAAYFLAIEVRVILMNVLADPAERNFRMIEMKTDTYTRRIAPVAGGITLLNEFGFQPDKANEWMILEKPDVNKINCGLRDLSVEIARLAPSTPISRAVKSLLAANEHTRATSFVELLQQAVGRIIEYPHDLKFHKINIEKFFKQTSGKIVGGTEFFALMGFVVDVPTQRAAVPYPDGFDPDLIRLRNDDLTRSWSAALADIVRRREVAAAE